MSPVFTCADIRRMITAGDLKNPALKEHAVRCQNCLAFGRKYLKEKKAAEAAGTEMKTDPQVLAAQLLAMSEEKLKQRKRIPRWLGIALGLLVSGIILLLFT